MPQAQPASRAQHEGYAQQHSSATANSGQAQDRSQKQSACAQLPGLDSNALPSLVGMTAAQVAEAVGYTGSQAQHAQQAQRAQQAKAPHAANKAAATNKLAVRKQANAKKKRSRETEAPSTNPSTLAGTSEHQAAAVQTEPATPCEGSIGTVSNTATTPAGISSNSVTMSAGVSSNIERPPIGAISNTAGAPAGNSSNPEVTPAGVSSNTGTIAPGVSSNTSTSPAEPAQELSSGQSAAGDEEHQKRMVSRHHAEHRCVLLCIGTLQNPVPDKRFGFKPTQATQYV